MIHSSWTYVQSQLTEEKKMHRFNRILLTIAVCGLATFPLLAQDQLELSKNSVTINGDDVVTDMSRVGFSVALTPENTGSAVTFSTIGTFESGVFKTYLDLDGITFPDQSDQQSAAYSKSETNTLLASLAPTEAWPMVCKTTVLDGNIPVDLSYHTLFCRSPQSGVPGGTIGSGAGVASGYFFVVTDVLANCGLGVNCDGVFFRLTRRNISDRIDIETWVFPVSSTTPAGDKSVAVQFAGPLMILGAGDYLVGLGSLSQTSGHFVYAQVMGYLTANPERLRP
jgi:hypothetical protein